MIYLNKAFGVSGISFCIDDGLFEQCYGEIESIFSTFSCGLDCQYNTKVYVISQQFGDGIITTEPVFVYDTDKATSYFLLAQYVEEIITQFLNCTTLHACLVRTNNRNTLIVGKRKSGKTTLVLELLKKPDTHYIDDDHVFIVGEEYLGLNMPVFHRNVCDTYHATKLYTVDEEGITREVLIPLNRKEMVNHIDLIIFPEYSAGCKTSVTRVRGFQLFNRIMENVKNHNNNPDLLNDIVRLSRESSSYAIRYSEFDWLDSII